MLLSLSRRNIAISPPGLATMFPPLGVFGDVAKGIMTIVIAIVLPGFVLLRVAVMVVVAMTFDSTVALAFAFTSSVSFAGPCARATPLNNNDPTIDTDKIFAMGSILSSYFRTDAGKFK